LLIIARRRSEHFAATPRRRKKRTAALSCRSAALTAPSSSAALPACGACPCRPRDRSAAVFTPRMRGGSSREVSKRSAARGLEYMRRFSVRFLFLRGRRHNLINGSSKKQFN